MKTIGGNYFQERERKQSRSEAETPAMGTRIRVTPRETVAPETRKTVAPGTRETVAPETLESQAREYLRLSEQVDALDARRKELRDAIRSQVVALGTPTGKDLAPEDAKLELAGHVFHSRARVYPEQLDSAPYIAWARDHAPETLRQVTAIDPVALEVVKAREDLSRFFSRKATSYSLHKSKIKGRQACACGAVVGAYQKFCGECGVGLG